jgi:glycosyltransferase involved in cell wall biosynthesis
LACGTPIVAFDTCGLPDIVRHQFTGYLAKAFDTEDLAQGIKWVIGDSERHLVLSKNSRNDAVSRFSYSIVAQRYIQLYKEVMA